MDVIAVSRKIQREMPIWYHRMSNGDRNLFNKSQRVVKCLKEKHRVRTVADAESLAEKRNTPRHSTTRANCQCGACRITRLITQCQHPGLCYDKCKAMLDSLEEKWDPRYPQPEDVEDEIAPELCENPNAVEFDPRITTHGTLADTFRIF
ncbi:hypothetical protein C8J57DRAFT_1061546, partial [Mycena rebaudengoi]